MTVRKVAIFFMSACIVAAACGDGRALEPDGPAISGLWRLTGIMPAGIPSEEIPGRLDTFQGYWFHHNGTVTLVDDRKMERTRVTGTWRQKGDKILIVWRSGVRMVIRVVRAEPNFLILTGFDPTPRWFRFTRFF